MRKCLGYITIDALSVRINDTTTICSTIDHYFCVCDLSPMRYLDMVFKRCFFAVLVVLFDCICFAGRIVCCQTKCYALICNVTNEIRICWTIVRQILLLFSDVLIKCISFLFSRVWLNARFSMQYDRRNCTIFYFGWRTEIRHTNFTVDTVTTEMVQRIKKRRLFCILLVFCDIAFEMISWLICIDVQAGCSRD